MIAYDFWILPELEFWMHFPLSILLIRPLGKEKEEQRPQGDNTVARDPSATFLLSYNRKVRRPAKLIELLLPAVLEVCGALE